MIDTSKLTRAGLASAVDWLDGMAHVEAEAAHELILAGAGIDKADLEAHALEVTERTRNAMFDGIAKFPAQADEIALRSLAIAYQFGALAMLKAITDLDGQDG